MYDFFSYIFTLVLKIYTFFYIPQKLRVYYRISESIRVYLIYVCACIFENRLLRCHLFPRRIYHKLFILLITFLRREKLDNLLWRTPVLR